MLKKKRRKNNSVQLKILAEKRLHKLENQKLRGMIDFGKECNCNELGDCWDQEGFLFVFWHIHTIYYICIIIGFIFI